MAGAPPALPWRASDHWILEHHGGWTRATLSLLFVSLADGTQHPDSLTRWLLDRALIARVLATACERVRDMLAVRGIEFPAVVVAQEEAEYLSEYATRHGLDLSPFRLSSEARGLIELIESLTNGGQWQRVAAERQAAALRPEGSDEARFGGVGLNGHGEGATGPPVGSVALCSAVTAIWMYLFVSWKGCSLSQRSRKIAQLGAYPTHSELCGYLSRSESLERIVDSQDVLDSLLDVLSKSAENLAKVQKTFGKMLNHCVATLESALKSNQKDARGPLCKNCTRSGHTSDNCTFQSRI